VFNILMINVMVPVK